MPRQHEVVSQRVPVGRMGQRANQRPVLTALRQQRQMFTDIDAGRARGNRIELTTNRIRRMRFQVKAVLLRKPPGQKDIDTGFRCPGTAGRRGSIGCGSFTQAIQVIHSKAYVKATLKVYPNGAAIAAFKYKQ